MSEVKRRLDEAAVARHLSEFTFGDAQNLLGESSETKRTLNRMKRKGAVHEVEGKEAVIYKVDEESAREVYGSILDHVDYSD
ncbi:hypothetical protein [Candidatus Nanohalococcus occultus]|uniref:hypothetical protein n=1 Tax=Candidatus Nanohalococcus occultus TaxID=2978047 RepID=UPI0039E0FC4E